MCDKDGTADNDKQQTSEGDTHHIGIIPQGSAIQRQNNRHTRGQHKAGLKVLQIAKTK